MRNQFKTVRTGSFRRWVKQLFASLIKQGRCHCQDDVLEKLQSIEEDLEIIAREMARHSRAGE